MNETEPTTNTFTEEGRILQVEYAIKNVSKAGTMLGSVCSDGIVIIGFKQGGVTGNHEKIYKISENIYAAVAGISSDAIQLISYARLQSENFIEKFSEEIPLKSLTQAVGTLKQRFTQGVGMRAFGVTFMYAGIIDEEYVILCTDPSGSITRWSSVSFGVNSDALNNALRADYKDNLTLHDATKHLFTVLKASKEIKEDDLKSLEVLHFKKDIKKYLKPDELKVFL